VGGWLAGWPLAAGTLPMLTAGPTTGSAHAVLELFLSSADTSFSGFLLLGIIDPADELVAGQRCDVLPGVECGGIGGKRLAQVDREFVYHPTGYSGGAHRSEFTGGCGGAGYRSEALGPRSADVAARR
jgi:hypothetical protein